MLRNQRTHNPKQAAPETRHTTRRAADRRGKGLGRPPIQHGVEHALEKILHGEEAQILGDRVDGCEEEDGCAHETRGEDHGPFAADGGDAISYAAEEDAEDTRGVGVDVACVGEGQGLVDVAVFEGEDAGEVDTWLIETLD